MTILLSYFESLWVFPTFYVLAIHSIYAYNAFKQ